jgi:hypothetical protein
MPALSIRIAALALLALAPTAYPAEGTGSCCWATPAWQRPSVASRTTTWWSGRSTSCRTTAPRASPTGSAGGWARRGWAPRAAATLRPDTSLPAGFLLARPNDYRNSGYDKGHLCPAADRSASREDMDATFLMTNIAPQAPALNRGPWEKLESYCPTRRAAAIRSFTSPQARPGWRSPEQTARAATSAVPGGWLPCRPSSGRWSWSCRQAARRPAT